MNRAKILAITTCFLFTGFTAYAQENSSVSASNADNTQVNVRDRNADESTADQAENNLSDRQLMQKIRKAVMADKSLSTYAHNVKIIAEDGNVTLKGPVRSEREHQKIDNIAFKVAGQDNVQDEISIKSKSQ